MIVAASDIISFLYAVVIAHYMPWM